MGCTHPRTDGASKGQLIMVARTAELAIWRGSHVLGNLAFTNAGWSSSVARWAHNPEVAGSNPVPATSGNGPRRTLRGPFSWPLGTLLGTLASLIVSCRVRWGPRVTDQKRRGLFGGVAVIGSDHVGIGL